MSLSTETIPVIDAIAPLGKGYAAWLVDIWGVMHNGVRAFPPAVEATRRYREQGGRGTLGFALMPFTRG